MKMDDFFDGIEMLNFRNVFIIVFEVGFLLLINLIVFLGNLFFCYVIYNKLKYYMIMNIFIFVLIMCYGFIVLFVMFFIVGVLIIGWWVFGWVVCDI